jgi:hypothetical protein
LPLFHKLVEERCELYLAIWKEDYKFYFPHHDGQELVLADVLQCFGIDYASWRNYEKETNKTAKDNAAAG